MILMRLDVEMHYSEYYIAIQYNDIIWYNIEPHSLNHNVTCLFLNVSKCIDGQCASLD